MRPGIFLVLYIDDVISCVALRSIKITFATSLPDCRGLGWSCIQGNAYLDSSKVLYLGHLISAEGIHPDPSKTKAVKEFVMQTINVKAVWRFLDLASYYGHFVPKFVKLYVCKLTACLNQGRYPFFSRWLNASKFLKDLLTSPPILAYPNFTAKFVLHTDASGGGIPGARSRL